MTKRAGDCGRQRGAHARAGGRTALKLPLPQTRSSSLKARYARRPWRSVLAAGDQDGGGTKRSCRPHAGRRDLRQRAVGIDRRAAGGARPSPWLVVEGPVLAVHAWPRPGHHSRACLAAARRRQFASPCRYGSCRRARGCVRSQRASWHTARRRSAARQRSGPVLAVRLARRPDLAAMAEKLKKNRSPVVNALVAVPILEHALVSPS